MSIILLLLGGASAWFLLWWLLIETEGVYLGKRVVVWLYDRYASRYDRVKQFDDFSDQVLLAEPLLDRSAQADSLILDVATGSGRFPLLMAGNGRFTGHVIGLDHSHNMLAVAAVKVKRQRFGQFISLTRGDAMNLPFSDSAFAAVTCLEALEFFPNCEAAIAELARVLRPGGLLLTSNRVDTRWMPGRTLSRARLTEIFHACDLYLLDYEAWQEDYDKVWARKKSAPDSQESQKTRES